LQTEQRNLIDGFVNKVKTALEEYSVDSEQLTVENLNQILDHFRDKLNVQLWTITNGGQSAVVQPECVETGENYKIHTHSGQLSRVPVDWHFPCCGVFDLWRQWWIGDQVRQVPPLRLLSREDVAFLNSIPLDADKMHGRTGKSKEKQRLARKNLNDMKFIMNWITKKVQEAGAMEQVITLSSVDRMFAVVAGEFSEGERNGQKKWNTLVRDLQTKQADPI